MAALVSLFAGPVTAVAPTPLVLGFILGPAFEEYLRRTLLFSRGDPGVLLTDPVSATCLALIAAASVWMVLRRLRVHVPA
ncbi:MAG: hypothetical protein ACXIUV_03860 [Alkalilacustris sp.]